MNPLLRNLTPSATDQIRAEHAQVMLAFRQYHTKAPPATKRALQRSVALALEMHAEIEEELFYPAVREVLAGEVGPELEVLDQSLPAHTEMRRLLDELRTMEPTGAGYDHAFLLLMREVMHHAADEESVLLPVAERLPAERFDALGAAMARRRLQLASRRAGEITSNTLQALPTSALFIAAGVVLTGGLLARRVLQRRAH